MTRKLRTKSRPVRPLSAKKDQQETPLNPEVMARPWLSRVPSAVWTILFFALVVAVTVSVYYRSLNRVFVADHLCYLAELNGSESLWDGLRLYDYAVSRQYAKGDESLYRPLFFVWLAINHWLFASNYFWWNVVQLGLHIGVTLLLYALLRTLQPSPVAGVFTLWFAVLNSQLEMVIWHHLGGYLWGYVFVLVALIAIHRFLDDQRPSKVPWLVVFSLSMTLAALFYEILVVLSALMAVYLFYREMHRPEKFRWRIVVASLIPGVVFTSLYIIHVLQCPRFFFADHVRHGDHAVMLVLDQAIFQIKMWLHQTLCPWDYSFVVRPFARGHFKEIGEVGASSYALELVAVACLLLIVGMWKTLSLEHLSRWLPLASVLATMVAAYSIIISIGRQGMYADNPYYIYFFSLNLVIIAYILPDWSPGKVRLIPVLAGLGVFVLINAILTFGSSTDVAKINHLPDRYFSSIRQFIAEHRHEPGFSFEARDFAPAGKQVDVPVGLLSGYPDMPTQQRIVPASGILFPRYYDPKLPRYLLHWDGASLVVAWKRS